MDSDLQNYYYWDETTQCYYCWDAASGTYYPCDDVNMIPSEEATDNSCTNQIVENSEYPILTDKHCVDRPLISWESTHSATRSPNDPMETLEHPTDDASVHPLISSIHSNFRDHSPTQVSVNSHFSEEPHNATKDFKRHTVDKHKPFSNIVRKATRHLSFAAHGGLSGVLKIVNAEREHGSTGTMIVYYGYLIVHYMM